MLSSAFLKGIGAIIDTDAETLWSKRLGRYLKISKTPKNLYLLDINQLWDEDTPRDIAQRSSVIAGSTCFATDVIKKEFAERDPSQSIINITREDCNYNQHDVPGVSAESQLGKPRVISSLSPGKDELKQNESLQISEVQADSRVTEPPIPDHVVNVSSTHCIQEELPPCNRSRENHTDQGNGSQCFGAGSGGVWNSWTDWFVKTYEWSGKESHIKYITYVEKRLDQEAQREQAGYPMPKAKTTAKKSAAKPKPVPGPKSPQCSRSQIGMSSWR